MAIKTSILQIHISYLAVIDTSHTLWIYAVVYNIGTARCNWLSECYYPEVKVQYTQPRESGHLGSSSDPDHVRICPCE